ncbi:MAG TPA: hypothetical protein VHS06_04780 [Chloroflexota bacterium]|nr:hypothetical protein [Chloroflexota bacterium]
MTLQLQAGSELDRLIHEKVVKGEGEAPAYSTDIAVAWKLWQGLPRPKRLHVDAARVHHCMCGGTDESADGVFKPDVWETADKMALAICRAALKMVEKS